MAEYIDRQEIIDTINAQRDVAAARKDFIGMSILNYLLDVIKDGDCVPAADVAPVVHGKWLNIDGDYTFASCSICAKDYEVATEKEAEKGLWGAFLSAYRFCPNCGAKMDEEAHNGT